MNKLTKSIDYNKALLQEQSKLYKHAISSYRKATLQTTPYLSDIYYRIAYLLDKEKKYKQSCETFLLMDNRVFEPKENTLEEKKKNEILLQKYLLEKDPFKVDNWLDFAKKSESLKCWNVASYAYKELLAREERFIPKYYKLLGYSLMQEKKYKEASKYFKEQKIIQSVEHIIEPKEEENSDYKAYYQRFPLEERIIMYESSHTASNRIYELYLDIDKDAHFDAYFHVWVVDNKTLFTNNIKSINSIIIQRDSDLHRRYLAKAKYIISNQKPLNYYRRKKEQFYIFISETNQLSIATHNLTNHITNYEIIQDVFFGNRRVASTKKQIDNYLNILYEEAIKEFNNKNYESSYKKFLELKKRATDVKYPLATSYYIQESLFRLESKEKNVEELLVYKQYQLSAENFAGADYFLEKACFKSLQNKKQWSELRENFLKIIEDIKKNDTKNIRSILDKDFLNKVEIFSKSFDDRLEAEFLPYQVWFLFSHLFIFARLYSKYQLVREKALSGVLKMKQVTNLSLLRYKINALSELGKAQEYNELRDKLLKEADSKYIQENLQFLGASELYFNRHSSGVELYKQTYTTEELAFSKYIKNKSIAIVGPLKSDLNLGEEIDSHDVVLRFNYRGLDKSLEKSHGTKTDISFYILEILIKDKINAKQVNYMNELDWVVFDTGHNQDSICFTGVTANLRSRYYDAYDYANPYFKGTANGIQRVLLDLLRFEVGKIKIYNTNLFLENSYDKNYKSRGSLGADHFNFIWHDPLSNFIFLKRLKEFKIIDTDEILEKILELTPNKYIEALEERYGNDTLNKSSV